MTWNAKKLRGHKEEKRTGRTGRIRCRLFAEVQRAFSSPSLSFLLFLLSRRKALVDGGNHRGVEHTMILQQTPPAQNLIPLLTATSLRTPHQQPTANSQQPRANSSKESSRVESSWHVYASARSCRKDLLVQNYHSMLYLGPGRRGSRGVTVRIHFVPLWLWPTGSECKKRVRKNSFGRIAIGLFRTPNNNNSIHLGIIHHASSNHLLKTQHGRSVCRSSLTHPREISLTYPRWTVHTSVQAAT